MEQLGNQLSDFHGILYLGIFRNFFENIQGSLKSAKNNEQLAQRPLHIYNHIAHIS